MLFFVLLRGTNETVVQSVQTKSKVLCASVDPALIASEACASAEWILTAEQASPMVWDTSADFGPGVKSDASTGLRTLSFAGGEEGEEIVLDLGVEVRSCTYCAVLDWTGPYVCM